jgi:hypothetical protein
MGTIVIKPDRDGDEYVLWDFEWDRPTACGTRAEMAQHLTELAGLWPVDAESLPEARLARADANGSSMIPYQWGWWDDAEFIYEQRGHLARRHLVRAVELLSEEREAEVWDLLVPFKGETEVWRG